MADKVLLQLSAFFVEVELIVICYFHDKKANFSYALFAKCFWCDFRPDLLAGVTSPVILLIAKSQIIGW